MYLMMIIARGINPTIAALKVAGDRFRKVTHRATNGVGVIATRLFNIKQIS